MTEASPSVYIVVLIYNNKDAVRRCLDSLGKATYRNLEIVLIDNLSPDGGGPEIRKDFPGCHFVANDRNLGFARGSNVGIRYALVHGADHILLLNGDMVVEPGFLEPMVALMESNRAVGLASGQIFHADNRESLWYAGGYIDFCRGQLVTPERNQTGSSVSKSPYQTRFCTGAMMLIRREIVATVGMLPEEYFFGVEEWDYSLQVQRHGYDLYVVPQAVAYHIAGESQDHSNAKWHYNFYRNKLIFQEKYLPRPLFGLWKVGFRMYVQWVLTGRTARLHGNRLGAAELVFAAKRALEDQTGTEPVFEEDLDAFEIELVEFLSE